MTQGVFKISSPEQLPDGPHFSIIIYSTKEVMVRDGSWENNLKPSSIPVIEHWIITDQTALAQFVHELHGQKFVILSVSGQGHLTQAVQF